MQLALALYNNERDEEDELEFRKGEILNVLIENPNGLAGWMLCEKNGQCGICPGNRLRLLSNITTTMNNDKNKMDIIVEKSLSSSLSSSSQVYKHILPLIQCHSEYDRLSMQYDYDIPISAHENDYDIPRTASTITQLKKGEPINLDSPIILLSSPESSSRSSGIYSTSTNDLLTDTSKCSSQCSLRHRSKSSDTCITDTISLDQLSIQFHNLSIRSAFPDKFYHLLVICDELIQSSSTKIDQYSKLISVSLDYYENSHQFLTEYGSLFNRHTYKQLKEILIKFEQLLLQFQQNLKENNSTINNELILQTKLFSTLSKNMFSLIRPTIELKLKEKHDSISIPREILKKLNLKSIDTNSDGEDEDNNKQQLQSLVSTNSIYDTFNNSKIDLLSPIVNRELTNSKTCHTSVSSEKSYCSSTKSTSIPLTPILIKTSYDSKDSTDTYDYIEDDYSITPSEIDPRPQSSNLLKYYYRHINEQINFMKLRYDKLMKCTKRHDGFTDSSYDNYLHPVDRNKQLILDEAKKFVVSGHKLVFVIETLQQYVAANTNNLSKLLLELCDSLTDVTMFIKQIVNDGDDDQRIVNYNFKHKAQQAMNIAIKIKQYVNKT
ncbi:unnamed protein product [Didymodactylos carnosus]|uniref:SH3 domain-containing protein n=1 Tax=Didymodactylos carnosus TaxID=1234261 RepID=A0A813PP49_9BILA|nr:unnamed protein product [Didymodactylos carnosus]CAF1163775.1 unnamed protein product [Didymodactylos carnosus]CAF3535978.1 unnamed protein product [Didymodactylos carnosus]CAF3975442.1 unnamed protein product [Didymodactylos carnosus]